MALAFWSSVQDVRGASAVETRHESLISLITFALSPQDSSVRRRAREALAALNVACGDPGDRGPVIDILPGLDKKALTPPAVRTTTAATIHYLKANPDGTQQPLRP